MREVMNGLERLREHLLKIDFGSDTNRDVRIEFLASCDRAKIGYVVDQSVLDIVPAIGAHERGSGPGLLRERRNRVQ